MRRLLSLCLLWLTPLLGVNNNDIQFLQVHNVPSLPGYVLAEPSSFGPQVSIYLIISLRCRSTRRFLTAQRVVVQYTESRLRNVTLILAEVRFTI